MARLMGETTYRGKRCRSCGCTERYVKSGSCTGCTKESAERMREIERAAKKRKRRSSPPEIDAEMNDLLGLNANSSMIENADTLPRFVLSIVIPLKTLRKLITAQLTHREMCMVVGQLYL
jgi:hypothetical protein